MPNDVKCTYGMKPRTHQLAVLNATTMLTASLPPCISGDELKHPVFLVVTQEQAKNRKTKPLE